MSKKPIESEGVERSKHKSFCQAFFKKRIEKMCSLPTAVWIVIISVIAVAVFLMNTVFKTGCIMKALFDVPCPVCGMTRAYLSLLTLDVSAAFNYNPAFWVFPLICLSGILAAADKKRTKKWLIVFFALILVLIVFWIVRLITGEAA